MAKAVIPAAPGERFGGIPVRQRRIRERLSDLRSTPGADTEHRHLAFTPLSTALCLPYVDTGLFHVGYDLLTRRYVGLGLHTLLPFDRVLVGIQAVDADAFGGFHYPGQGYRHMQMQSIITIYGDLARHSATPELAALDLLRAYAHDCLHFGSYRRYLLTWRTRTIVRVQYGINLRRRDGRTYSAPDPVGATSTRNLGILMEGATDREATAITRQVADGHGLRAPATGCDHYEFNDVTGRLDADDLRRLAALTEPPFLRRMYGYHEQVTAPYAGLVAELGGASEEALHRRLVVAMLSGSVADLLAWLDERHGPGAFARLFRSPAYGRI